MKTQTRNNKQVHFYWKQIEKIFHYTEDSTQLEIVFFLMIYKHNSLDKMQIFEQ